MLQGGLWQTAADEGLIVDLRSDLINLRLDRLVAQQMFWVC